MNILSTQSLPGSVVHSYALPGAAWDVPTQKATVVDSVPFTHPAHVPALLELLRHQCAINTLLRSCFSARRTSAGGTTFTLQESHPMWRTSLLQSGLLMCFFFCLCSVMLWCESHQVWLVTGILKSSQNLQQAFLWPSTSHMPTPLLFVSFFSLFLNPNYIYNKVTLKRFS